jgi:hypothetical protein
MCHKSGPRWEPLGINMPCTRRGGRRNDSGPSPRHPWNLDSTRHRQQLATRAHVAVATVRKIETGAVIEPGYFTVIAPLRALGITPLDIGS